MHPPGNRPRDELVFAPERLRTPTTEQLQESNSDNTYLPQTDATSKSRLYLPDKI